jgi:hypothetical protein
VGEVHQHRTFLAAPAAEADRGRVLVWCARIGDIAGYTIYDANVAALLAIVTERTSAGSLAQQVAYFSDATQAAGFANRQNGDYFLLADVTVFNDPSRDTLSGGPGRVWLFADVANKIQG